MNTKVYNAFNPTVTSTYEETDEIKDGKIEMALDVLAGKEKYIKFARKQIDKYEKIIKILETK